MYDKEFIITISDFDKNTTAKRKGLAFEALVWYTLSEGSRIPVTKEQEITKAIEEHCKEKYHVKRKFNLIFNEGKIKEFNRSGSETIFDENTIPKNCEIKLIYRKEDKTVEQIFNETKEVVKYLLNEGFIHKINSRSIFQKFRLDFWRQVGENFCIIECKNKEKSFLEKREIDKTRDYGKIVKENISLGYILIVFNGYLKNNESEINNDYDIEIRLRDIRKWLINFAERTRKIIDFLVFSKHNLYRYGFEIKKAGKNSKLFLNIKTSEYNNSDTYEPVDLLITDDLSEIKSFIQRKNKQFFKEFVPKYKEV